MLGLALCCFNHFNLEKESYVNKLYAEENYFDVM